MDYDKNSHERLKSLKCCIVAPTYNNAATLEHVLTEVMRYAGFVIVVNDGSTDDTPGILNNIVQRCTQPDYDTKLHIINLPINKGKGYAMRQGFAYAHIAGFKYAITIDTDGQHFADDIPAFIDKIRRNPGAALVGARNMKQDGIPTKSSFGNRFSNFWYRVETGITLPDTQSGFRLYPLERIKNMRFITRKYEFEIESLVRMAWAGIPVKSIPIKVHYEKEENRVSHFRPVRDFARISSLNTILVLIAFLWIKPYHAIRRIRWKSFKRLFRRELKMQSALKVACAAGFGVFMGIVPIWGYQLIVGLPLAHFMKLNKTVVFIAANISIPPMIPIILYISYLMGGLLLGTSTNLPTLSNISLDFVKQNTYQYLLGSIVFAITAGLLVTSLVWLSVSLLRNNKSSRRIPNS